LPFPEKLTRPYPVVAGVTLNFAGMFERGRRSRGTGRLEIIKNPVNRLRLQSFAQAGASVHAEVPGACAG